MQFSSQDFWALGAENQICPHPSCGLMPPSGHRLIWFKYPWAQLVSFGKLQHGSSSDNFWLVVSHFVGLIRMISLGESWECRNPRSPSLLLEMVLPGMALPSLLPSVSHPFLALTNGKGSQWFMFRLVYLFDCECYS